MAQRCGKSQANEQGGVLQQFRTCLQTQGERVTHEAFFPMYVVRMEEFMRMTEARPHQTLRLEGVVADFVFFEECPIVIFVSHQWCSRNHPDPYFKQLGLLQRALKRIFDGTITVEVDFFSFIVFKARASVSQASLKTDFARAVIWYDYFGVPQPSAAVAESDQHTDLSNDMGKAVNSIPAYVEATDHFMGLPQMWSRRMAPAATSCVESGWMSSGR